MLEFFRKLFDSDFMPHGHCYYWQQEIVWLHVASDALIAISYYVIPLSLVYLSAGAETWCSTGCSYFSASSYWLAAQRI